MSKKNRASQKDLRPEYNFRAMRGGVRGKYAERFRSGTNLVHLEPDVARVFLDDASANHTLRSLIKIARSSRLIHDYVAGLLVPNDAPLKASENILSSRGPKGRGDPILRRMGLLRRPPASSQ